MVPSEDRVGIVDMEEHSGTVAAKLDWLEQMVEGLVQAVERQEAGHQPQKWLQSV